MIVKDHIRCGNNLIFKVVEGTGSNRASGSLNDNEIDFTALSCFHLLNSDTNLMRNYRKKTFYVLLNGQAFKNSHNKSAWRN